MGFEMGQHSKQFRTFLLPAVALLSWLIPGAGYYLLGEKKRAIIIFVSITLTFAIGIYIGSVGVVNPEEARAWFVAQIMNSPLVILLANMTSGGGYPVYGRVNEIGQIYTAVAGLLNLLCIINEVYLANLSEIKQSKA